MCTCEANAQVIRANDGICPCGSRCDGLSDDEGVNLLRLVRKYSREYGGVDPNLTLEDFIGDLAQSMDPGTCRDQAFSLVADIATAFDS